MDDVGRKVLKAVVRRSLQDAIRKYSKMLGVSRSYLLDLIRETINEMRD